MDVKDTRIRDVNFQINIIKLSKKSFSYEYLINKNESYWYKKRFSMHGFVTLGKAPNLTFYCFEKG